MIGRHSQNVSEAGLSIRYSVFQSIEDAEETGSYTTYGLAGMCGEETRFSIKDISTNRSELEQLADRMNVGELSQIHFRDVVDDFLAR